MKQGESHQSGLHDCCKRFKRLNVPGGYVTPRDSVVHLYVPDYQGNNVAVINTKTGQAEQLTDYYPYGQPINNGLGASVNPYKYKGIMDVFKNKYLFQILKWAVLLSGYTLIIYKVNLLTSFQGPFMALAVFFWDAMALFFIVLCHLVQLLYPKSNHSDLYIIDLFLLIVCTLHTIKFFNLYNNENWLF